jgi:hypothetical protein
MGGGKKEPKVKIEGYIGVPLTIENMLLDFMVAYVKSYSIHLTGMYLFCLKLGVEREKCYDKTLRYANKLSEVATRYVMEYVSTKSLENNIIVDTELEGIAERVVKEMEGFLESGGEGGEARPTPSSIHM